MMHWQINCVNSLIRLTLVKDNLMGIDLVHTRIPWWISSSTNVHSILYCSYN